MIQALIPTRYWFFRVRGTNAIAYGYDHNDGKYYWFVDEREQLVTHGRCASQAGSVETARFVIERLVHSGRIARESS